MRDKKNLPDAFDNASREPPLTKLERLRIQKAIYEENRALEIARVRQRESYDMDLAEARAEAAREHSQMQHTPNGRKPLTKAQIEAKAVLLVEKRNAEQRATIARVFELKREAILEAARKKHGLSKTDQQQSQSTTKSRSADLKRDFDAAGRRR